MFNELVLSHGALNSSDKIISFQAGQGKDNAKVTHKISGLPVYKYVSTSTPNKDDSDRTEMDSGYKSPDVNVASPELFQNQMGDPKVQALFDEYYNTVR